MYFELWEKLFCWLMLMIKMNIFLLWAQNAQRGNMSQKFSYLYLLCYIFYGLLRCTHITEWGTNRSTQTQQWWDSVPSNGLYHTEGQELIRLRTLPASCLSVCIKKTQASSCVLFSLPQHIHCLCCEYLVLIIKSLSTRYSSSSIWYNTRTMPSFSDWEWHPVQWKCERTSWFIQRSQHRIN